MKNTFLLLLGSTLVFCGISCNKTDSGSNASGDYSKLIVGNWFKDAVADNNLVELSLGTSESNSAVYYDLINQDWGVMAYGTFTINGNKLTIVFDDVEVTDEEYEPSSRNGFTDDKSKIVNYTITSCDGEKLVMQDDANKISTWTK